MHRSKLKDVRREALNKLFKKYPKGFSVRTMMEENSKLFSRHKQAADFLGVIREQEGCIEMKREGTACLYTYVPDTYKLLTDLWRNPHSASIK